MEQQEIQTLRALMEYEAARTYTRFLFALLNLFFVVPKYQYEMHQFRSC